MKVLSRTPWFPSTIPADVQAAIRAIAADLQLLKRGLEDSSSYGYLEYLHEEPEVYFAGMEVLADGTNWNPGSGAGKYIRDEDNASWVFQGGGGAAGANTLAFAARHG